MTDKVMVPDDVEKRLEEMVTHLWGVVIMPERWPEGGLRPAIDAAMRDAYAIGWHEGRSTK